MLLCSALIAVQCVSPENKTQLVILTDFYSKKHCIHLKLYCVVTDNAHKNFRAYSVIVFSGQNRTTFV